MTDVIVYYIERDPGMTKFGSRKKYIKYYILTRGDTSKYSTGSSDVTNLTVNGTVVDVTEVWQSRMREASICQSIALQILRGMLRYLLSRVDLM